MTTLTNAHLSQARAILNKLALGITVSTLIGGCVFAQETADTSSALADATATVMYNFQNVVFPKDTFVQLLGINKEGTIAGYHGIGGTDHPFRGFELTLPRIFAPENVPHAAQTQVVGINDQDETAGFFIDAAGVNHGFLFDGARFKTVDLPGTPFNQLLGVNNFSQAAGYYADAAGIDHAYIFDRSGNVFLTLTIPNSQGGA